MDTLYIMDGGKITFGDDVLVGPDCTFVTAVHSVEPEKRLAGYQVFKPISVGNNVWFGAGVLVCPGDTIGDNCVIGVGSVVVNDIPANCVAVGNPCRIIRKITEIDKNGRKARETPSCLMKGSGCYRKISSLDGSSSHVHNNAITPRAFSNGALFCTRKIFNLHVIANKFF